MENGNAIVTSENMPCGIHFGKESHCLNLQILLVGGLLVQF